MAPGEGETFRLDTLGAWRTPGTLIALQEAQCTCAAAGPVMLWRCWAKGEQAPLYVVRNMAPAEEACRGYEKRFRSATVCSDQQSRGFHSHKAHISDVQRLSRV